MKKDEQNKFTFGKVYFFKNGTIHAKPLTLTDEEFQYLIRQYGEKGNQMAPISTEEQAISLSKANTRSKRVAYQFLCEKGYAVVRVAKYLEVSKNHIEKLTKQTVETFIPPTINVEDASHVQQVFHHHEQKPETVRTCVTNFIEDDFDYYNPLRISTNNPRKQLPSSTILDYYLREKIGQLSKDEQVMFEKYRNFNLEEILTCQNQGKYPINHADSGIILITADQCFKRTVKKMQHNPEIFSLQEKVHPTLNLYGKELPHRLEITSDVMIYLVHQNIFCFLPAVCTLTDFQKSTINQLLEEVKQIQANYDEKIFIDAEEQSYKPINYYSVAELQNVLNPKKIKLFAKRKKKRH